MNQTGVEILQRVEKGLRTSMGSSFRVMGSTTVGGGCISHSALLDTTCGRFFLKWNSGGPADLFVREAEALAELGKAASSHLVIPRVFQVEGEDSGTGYIVMEYLGEGKGNSDEALGYGLALLHRYRNDFFGFFHDNYCGLTLQKNSWSSNWPDFYSSNRIGTLVERLRATRKMTDESFVVYKQLLQRIPLLLPPGTSPALIHGDLWAGNFMAVPGGAALFDPASCYADREMEFGMITLFGGFSSRFWSAYQESYPLSPDWKERNRLYQLYHLLNHYLLFGGGYGRQALEIARSYL